MTRLHITNHHELRQDVSIDCSSPIMTDQSFKNACDINVIMANYAKTGMLSHTTTKEPQYIDCTNIPSLERAYDIVIAAQNAFDGLPPDIRRLMDNDPQNLENFVKDPKNAHILEQNGLVLKKEPLKTDKPAVPMMEPKQDKSDVKIP